MAAIPTSINVFTAAELEEFAQRAAEKAVNEYIKAQQAAAKKSKYHNTFLLMKSYRDAAFHIENAVSEAAQISGGDNMHENNYLRSIRKTRFKTQIMKAHIDTVLDEMQRRREAAGRGAEFEAFDMYFMQGMTYEQIAEALNAGKNTPRRWISAIINEMSVLLWGIDEERI